MAIDRTAYNALVDDDGSNTVGSVWNKNAIKTVLLDPTDAAMGGQWSTVPFDPANYTASAGSWIVTAASNPVTNWTIVNGHTTLITFNLGGTMTISAATTSLYIALPAPIPVSSFAVNNTFHYYVGGVAIGNGYIERMPSALRLLRDAGGTPFPAVTNGGCFFFGQIFCPF